VSPPLVAVEPRTLIHQYCFDESGTDSVGSKHGIVGDGAIIDSGY